MTPVLLYRGVIALDDCVVVLLAYTVSSKLLLIIIMACGGTTSSLFWPTVVCVASILCVSFTDAAEPLKINDRVLVRGVMLGVSLYVCLGCFT